MSERDCETRRLTPKIPREVEEFLSGHVFNRMTGFLAFFGHHAQVEDHDEGFLLYKLDLLAVCSTCLISKQVITRQHFLHSLQFIHLLP